MPASPVPIHAAAETPLQRFLRQFFASRIAAAGFIALALIVAAALCAPLGAPQDPYDLARIDILDSRLEPGRMSTDGSI